MTSLSDRVRCEGELGEQQLGLDERGLRTEFKGLCGVPGQRPKAKGHLRAHDSAPPQPFVDRLPGHAERLRSPGHCQPVVRKEVLAQPLAGVRRPTLQLPCVGDARGQISVGVAHVDVVGVAVGEAKAHAPSIVHRDGVLTLAVGLEGVKSVA
jgi:hypothetical protein